MATRDDYGNVVHPWFRDRVSDQVVMVPSGFQSRSNRYPWINSDLNVRKLYGGQYWRMRDFSNPVRGIQNRMNTNRVKAGLPPYDIGFPMWSERVGLSLPTHKMAPIHLGPDYSYRVPVGYLYPSVGVQGKAANLGAEYRTRADKAGVPFQDMLYYGTTGIKRSLPGMPPISVFQLLGEIREGLPRIPGSTLFDWKLVAKNIREDPSRIRHIFTSKGSPARKKAKLSSAGGEYLNIVFGVMPSVQSVLDVIDIAHNYPLLREQWQRAAGNQTRRHRVVKDEVTENSYVTSERPWPQVDTRQPTGTLTTYVRESEQVWVDTSWSPSPVVTALDRWLSGMPDWVSLLGVAPNAANLWELIPFSWLVDYFTNAGDVLNNLSYGGANGYYLSYAYTMAHKVRYTRWTWQGSFLGVPVTTTVVEHTETKQRIRATPYGFGLDPDGLSPSQLATLAALGISRARFHS